MISKPISTRTLSLKSKFKSILSQKSEFPGKNFSSFRKFPGGIKAVQSAFVYAFWMILYCNAYCTRWTRKQTSDNICIYIYIPVECQAQRRYGEWYTKVVCFTRLLPDFEVAGYLSLCCFFDIFQVSSGKYKLSESVSFYSPPKPAYFERPPGPSAHFGIIRYKHHYKFIFIKSEFQN